MADWLISSEESGLSLAAFLKTKLGPIVSGRKIKRGIEAGNCVLNGKIERFSSKTLGRGDRLAFKLPESERDHRIASEMDFTKRILYIDEDILAIDKLPGISSDDPNFINFLHTSYPFLTLLHRLDRDTSGVLLFARSLDSEKLMLELFKKRKINKTYLALVDAIPSKSKGQIENFLGKLSVYQGQTIWGSVSKERGLSARTDWKSLKKGKEASLLLCSPHTGRTHQIRVHLSELGHPILGDYQYGRAFKCQYRPSRMLLHASELSFEHPITNSQIVIAAPMPHDFSEAIKILLGP